MTPRRLYRALALAEVVTWTLLIIGMVLKYVTHTTELGVRVGGGIHGFVFLAYCVATVLVGVDGRWGVARVLAGLASSVVPFATVPFERATERRGLLADRWRLLREAPDGVVEQVAAWIVRHPRGAVVVTLTLLAAVFRVLIRLGPPTEWGG